MIAGMATLALSSAVYGQHNQAPPSRPAISVSGEAVVFVRPDKIVINLGIETWDSKSIIVAKEKNNAIHRRAMIALKELSVPEKEIQTDYLSIDPKWESYQDRDKIVGYYVRNALQVTISDPAKVERLIARMLEVGVNHIHGIDFQTTELKKYREQAREMALIAAQEKANKMATVLGQTIGAPVSISVNSSYDSWRWWGGRSSSQMSQNAAQNVQSGQEGSTGTVALGKIPIRANVSVTFELKN